MLSAEMWNLILNVVVTIVAIGVIPFVNSVYRAIRELSAAIIATKDELHRDLQSTNNQLADLKTSHGKLETHVSSLKWFDEFASDTRAALLDLREKNHKLELELAALRAGDGSI